MCKTCFEYTQVNHEDNTSIQIKDWYSMNVNKRKAFSGNHRIESEATVKSDGAGSGFLVSMCDLVSTLVQLM